MGKLIVCGDSWMSPSISSPKAHCSELVAEYLGHELIAYSRAGMSNGGIAIQLDTAIKNNPDYILVGITHADRIELSIEDTPKDIFKGFTVENIDYLARSESLSSRSDWVNKNPMLISTNLHEILNSRLASLSLCDDPVKKKNTVENWFKYMYHPSWKRQIDIWMMYAVLHKLHLSGIPYAICFDPIGVTRTCSWLSPSMPKLIEDINIVIVNQKQNKDNLLFHTSVDTQKEITKLLINYICLNSPSLN